MGRLRTSQNLPGTLISNSILNSVELSGSITITQSIITGGISTYPDISQYASISNTIFTHSSFSFPGSVTNCLSIENYLPAGAGNINGATNIFIVNGGTEDSKWQLSPDSPARGAGSGGSDIGAFGGSNPYVLSGVPGLPRITRLSVPATATSSSGLFFEVEAQAFTE